MSDSRMEWADANRRYLASAIVQVRQLLDARAATVRGEQPDMPLMVSGGAALAELAASTPSPPALDRLCRVFGLSVFERNVLLMCAASELDASFAAACGAAHGDPRRTHVTFGLALTALPDPHWSAVTPNGPLRKWRLVEVKAGSTLTNSTLTVDERILHFLAGVPDIDERLSGAVEEVDTGAELVPSHGELADRVLAAWRTAVRQRARFPLIQLSGADHEDKAAIARAACATAGLRLYMLDFEATPSTPSELSTFVRLLSREARLGPAAILVRCDDTADRTRTLALSTLMQRLREPLMLAVRDRIDSRGRVSVALDVAKPQRAEQRAAWRAVLNGTSEKIGDELDVLVGQFDLSATAIRSIGVDAGGQIEPQADASNARRLLWEACRAQARPRLEDLAQHVEARAGWDDLVLPDAQRQVLRDIAIHVRNRSRVYESWGFEARGTRGLGISAMFAGASGTGKTMAAEVLARELHLDLFRIDLSSLVSKYIGETEKNLRRVFDAAEDGGSILLFDEADALFGKRSEVKDSHDRYANIEVGYLLQRMEAFRGLAVLTTNLKSALDAAFLRRIRFIVQFPFPDAVQRAEIWRRAFPEATPTHDLDPDKLGRLNVAGGNIRNIALHAAFLAADENEPVRMRHLHRAAQSEYAKLEKVLSDFELAGWR